MANEVNNDIIFAGGCISYKKSEKLSSQMLPFTLPHRTREKTRELAHSRRQRENDTFLDIAETLPIQENTKDLDKASILRVAIHYLKLRDVLSEGSPSAPDGEEEATLDEDGEAARLGQGRRNELFIVLRIVVHAKPNMTLCC